MGRQREKLQKNASFFRLLSRMWISQIYEVLLIPWIFKCGNYFLTYPVLINPSWEMIVDGLGGGVP